MLRELKSGPIAPSRPPAPPGRAIVPPTAASATPTHALSRALLSAPSDLSSLKFAAPSNANQQPESASDSDITLPFIDASFMSVTGVQPAPRPPAQRPMRSPPFSADCSPFRAPLARVDTDTGCSDGSPEDEQLSPSCCCGPISNSDSTASGDDVPAADRCAFLSKLTEKIHKKTKTSD